MSADPGPTSLPFSLERIQNLLSDLEQELASIPATSVRVQALKVEIEGLKVDPTRREVWVLDQLVELTNTEFKLLHFLMRQPGVVFTRTQIVDGVHGDDYPVTDRSVDVQVVGLRKKLGEVGALIETVRGVGYRFKG